MMSNILTRVILPGYVHREWPEAAPLVAKALPYSHGEVTIDHVYEALLQGTTRLITVREEKKMIAAVVISMHDYPAKRVCQISYAGGADMEKWAVQGIELVKALAKQAGASGIIIQGRKGWVKVFKEIGFEEYSTLIGMEI